MLLDLFDGALAERENARALDDLSYRQLHDGARRVAQKFDQLGIRPGERTAQYIDTILTRVTVLGAAYLALICLLPEMLISYAALPFYFGGTSLLIVVSVTMDTVAQIMGHLQAHQYEGLVKKAKLRGKRR